MPIDDFDNPIDDQLDDPFDEWGGFDGYNDGFDFGGIGGGIGSGGGSGAGGEGGIIMPPFLDNSDEPANEDVTMKQILSYLDNRLANNPDNVGYLANNDYHDNDQFPNVHQSDKDYASKIRANIARQEYNDYIRRFQPIEQELMWSVDNPLLKAIDQYRTTANVHSAFLNTNAQKKRTMQRYGLQVDGTSVKNNAIARSAALAKARNETRRAGKQRDINIMGGGLNASATTRLTTEGGQ